MTEYALYLESGPRRRKTMVHVLDLLGCIAQGATTEAALDATPGAIRAYLDFIQRRGEAVDAHGAFSTAVAAHVMQGNWLANGDPTPGFAPDFQPLTLEELTLFLPRLDWLGDALLEPVRGLSLAQLLAEPPNGRSIYEILRHVTASQGIYLRMTMGKVAGLSEALKAVEQGPEEISAHLARVWQICGARLAVLTETERIQVVTHGQTLWTARRGMRRSLEHAWEHLQELSTRLTV